MLPLLKKYLFCSFFFFVFYWKIFNLSIFLKSVNIVKSEICLFQLSHIWDASHGRVQVFWLSQFIKHPISPSLLKSDIMFVESLRIVEDGFYFRDITLLTCPKKVTLGLKVFKVNCLIFIKLSSIYRYVTYIEGNHCITPFSIFSHCFINLER